MAPDRPSRPSTWRQWLRLTGLLLVFHLGSAAALLSSYEDAALSHEEARMVLQRLQARFERSDDASDGMSFTAVLSEIAREWQRAEDATMSLLVLATLSWLLTSCAALPIGRPRQPSAA